MQFDFCKRHAVTYSCPLPVDGMVLTTESVEEDGNLVSRSKYVPYKSKYHGMDANIFDLGNVLASGVNPDFSKPLYLSRNGLTLNEAVSNVKIVEQ